MHTDGIAHAQYGGGHGPLAVWEPVLWDLCWHAGDEGAGHPGGRLAQQGHPVLHVQRHRVRYPRERAQAAEQAAEAWGEKKIETKLITMLAPVGPISCFASSFCCRFWLIIIQPHTNIIRIIPSHF